jgi:putative CocE/NonD family hydrolase
MADWPAFQPTSYYFQKDGSLTTAKPTTDGKGTYLYDPHNPVPTEGGNNLALKCGPLDQQHIEQPHRADVLTFSSSVLTSPLALTGPINAVLYVSSNCTDTDFTVKLTDVYPNGESHLIQDGGVRMRWRLLSQGANSPTLMTPGTVYRVEASLWNTSYVFNTGHKLRVSVSSSNAPRLSINPNNGLPLSKNGTGPILVAQNTVYFSSSMPSSVVLPLVSLSQLPKHHITMPNLEEYFGDDAAAIKAANLMIEREANTYGMSLAQLRAAAEQQ